LELHSTEAKLPRCAKQIGMSMYVDDPMIVLKKPPEGQKGKAWFFEMIEKRFAIKKIDTLTPRTPIDYCSLKIQLELNRAE
jgi:hypothetical protein